MMKLFFNLMLMIGTLSLVLARHHQRGQQLLDTTGRWDSAQSSMDQEPYDLDRTSNDLEIERRLSDSYFEKLLLETRLKGIEQRGPYLFKRNINPRSPSYITLCHFKICNMGKRNRN